MAALHQHQLQIPLSVVVMVCLCIPMPEPVFAKGDKRFPSVQRKKQHFPVAKQKPKPDATHTWTKRSPSHQEFTVTTTESAKKNSPVTTDGINPLKADNYTLVPTPQFSVFHHGTSPDNPNAIPAVRADLTGNHAPESMYDGQVKSYTFGSTNFELNYKRQNDRALETTQDILSGKRQFGIDQNRFIESPLDRDTWHLGMDYAVGKGRFNTAIDYIRVQDDKKTGRTGNDLQSITFGYTHNVSENTSFYGSVTHTEYDTDNNTENTGIASPEDGNINQINVGIKHRF